MYLLIVISGNWENFEQRTCRICGPRKHFKLGAWELTDEESGRGINVADKLLEFLLRGLPRGFKTYAYAHNGNFSVRFTFPETTNLGAKYDAHPILKSVCKRPGIRPEVTASGNKIMEIRIKGTKGFNEVTLRDSCLLFPMKLDECPKTFDLKRFGKKMEGKSWFPYLYNRAENYGLRHHGLPPPDDYLIKTKTKAQREAFFKWYNEHKHEEFDLCEKLDEYCSNDTLILLYAVLKWRDIFNQLAKGADVFANCCTITGACMRLFRCRFLKKDTLAIVPNHGYLGGRKQSGKALKYLKWFAETHNVKMQHRDTDEGEHVVPRSTHPIPGTTPQQYGSYLLDGYIPVSERLKPDFKECGIDNCLYCYDPAALERDTAIEFHGCAWHGCEECFPNETRLPNGKSSDQARQETKDKFLKLNELGYHIIEFWECAVDRELKKNENLKKWFDLEHDMGPIEPRDAFFGGRVHPTRMMSESAPGRRKKHCDVVSLYPSVLRNEYPVGHPEFHHFRWSEGLVNWTHPDHVPYKGLIKCLVLPPKDLFLPLLPFRDDQRLLFPLCRTCAVESRKQSAYGKVQCKHTDDQREFVTTVTHFELHEALRRGYVVKRLVEYWHYETLDPTIFRGYINEFMKFKACFA